MSEPYAQTYLNVLLLKVVKRDGAQVVVVRVILNDGELGVPEPEEEGVTQRGEGHRCHGRHVVMQFVGRHALQLDLRGCDFWGRGR